MVVDLVPAIPSPHAAVVGEKRKREAVDNSGPPVKRLKSKESGVEEGDVMDVDIDPEKGDAMDVDAGQSVGELAQSGVEDDAMNVDPELVIEDSLNGRLRSHVFGDREEFFYERITHLS
jgi:hypothetical protein